MRQISLIINHLQSISGFVDKYKSFCQLTIVAAVLGIFKYMISFFLMKKHTFFGNHLRKLLKIIALCWNNFYVL